jgi:hypothetical protein
MEMNRQSGAQPWPFAADVDEMSEASFPASDPPAVWTWDAPPSPPPCHRTGARFASRDTT